LLAVVATAQANTACEVDLPPPPPPHPTVLTPLADGFPVPNQGLSGQRKGLVQGFDETQSVDRVLHLRQWEYCRQAVTAALTPAADIVPAYADAYIKQTDFDNTPYRFNMTQNGQRMTADDFDAWLQANGYSVGRRVELEN